MSLDLVPLDLVFPLASLSPTLSLAYLLDFKTLLAVTLHLTIATLALLLDDGGRGRGAGRIGHIDVGHLGLMRGGSVCVCAVIMVTDRRCFVGLTMANVEFRKAADVRRGGGCSVCAGSL